jgi:hypothetical protein
MHLPRLSFVLMLALVSLVSACTKRQPVTQDVSQEVPKEQEAARQKFATMERKLGELPQECTLGSARQVLGKWVTTEHVESESIQPTAVVYSLALPVWTNAFRVVLNPNGLHALDKVEVRDAEGHWRLAWSGVQPDAPPACEYVWLQQNIEGNPRPLTALRISFRASADEITSSAAGLLQAAPSAGGT